MSRPRRHAGHHARRPRQHAHVRQAPREDCVESWVARSSGDLVAMAPPMIGFHPTDSLVLLTFGAPAAFHARTDLPGSRQDGVVVAEMLAGACQRNGATSVAVLLYTDDHDHARELGEQVMSAMEGVAIDVVQVLRVHDGRWFEALLDDVAGTPYDLSTHPFTARAVLSGRAVHADRDAIRAMLRGGDPAERRRLATACDLRLRLSEADADPDALHREAVWLRARVQQAVSTGEPVGTADAARMLVAVVRGDVRDAAWVDLRRATAARHVALWLDLVRRAPEELLPGACGLLAMAAYLQGDGALAWCAVDRSREVLPVHSLVDLVADAVSAAIPPHDWPMPAPETLPLLRGRSA